MKKIICFLSIILCLILFVGCGGESSNCYFYFVNNSCVINIGESINIFELEYKTNISISEHMHISLSDSSIATLSGNTLTAVQSGDVVVTLEDSQNNVKAELNVKVLGGVSSHLSYEVISNDVLENKNYFSLQIKKDDNLYTNFNFSLVENLTDTQCEINKTQAILSVVCDSTLTFSIKILDKADNTFIIFSFPLNI